MELALSLPLLCLLLLGVVQVAVVTRDHLAVQLAAREAARRAAAGDSASAAEAAGRAAVALSPLEVDVRIRGGAVTAEVRYVEHTDVPLIGAVLPDVVVRAEATMVLEAAVTAGSTRSPDASSPP